MSDTSLRLKIAIRVMSGDEIAMGPGKADLLEAIDATGSISAAGRAMDMSYRRAWLLVDAMNRCWASPLVETMPNGAARSGARLSLAGRKVLDAYRALQSGAAMVENGAEWQSLKAQLLPIPREHQ
ncbi:winged helix-turn-helix domain-containing protein [Novosphingobium sediminicola]|uniref:Molybdate transport system regulatory protein n=1 Tax=Novosphingobium sediminicola TaxID=563162 RepID=A0A7W6CL58_9SPHN|nr:LysR family transcriptional regulator [Novosphingobium sediminicola]MBB3954966.1 molybdate transport system regulatory protein [Novosphingobium sediminicola]